MGHNLCPTWTPWVFHCKLLRKCSVNPPPLSVVCKSVVASVRRGSFSPLARGCAKTRVSRECARLRAGFGDEVTGGTTAVMQQVFSLQNTHARQTGDSKLCLGGAVVVCPSVWTCSGLATCPQCFCPKTAGVKLQDWSRQKIGCWDDDSSHQGRDSLHVLLYQCGFFSSLLGDQATTFI